MSEVTFEVDPAEDLDQRMTRWDKWLAELQDTGYTVGGSGPDGDEPVRVRLVDEADLAGPYLEFYRKVRL